jgi:hypothetical protein
LLCSIQFRAERPFFHPVDEDLSPGTPALAEKPRLFPLVQRIPMGNRSNGKAASIVIAGPTPFVKTVCLLFLVLATLPALAQRRDQFYNGVRDGGRGGNYYNQRDRDWDRRHRRDQGGVGPGTGALIGAGGGAVLGTLIGGGLKGTIVGGAAGAGIGAILGQANQNSKRNDRRHR